MAQSLSQFTTNIKNWNKAVCNFIGTHKKSLMSSLLQIQKALDHAYFDHLA